MIAITSVTSYYKFKLVFISYGTDICIIQVIPVFSRSTTVSTHTQRDHDCENRKDSSSPTTPITPTSSVSSFGEEYAYRSGYVQHALGRDLLSNPQHTVALLCGMR